MTSQRATRNFLLAWGLFALLVAGFSAYDGTRPRPTDGAIWLLGGELIQVVGIVDDGPAERAGLRLGDVVEGIDGKAIRNPRHAASLLQSKKVGDEVPYLFRRGEDVLTTKVTLGSTRLTRVSTYLVYCAVGLIYFLAGAYVFLRNSTQTSARLFYLLCTLFLIYFFSASERSAYYYWSDLFVRNIGTFASLMVPPLFLHFFLVFPERRRVLDRRRWLLPLLYLIPIAFYASFSYEQLFGTRGAKIDALQQLALGFYFTAGLASLVSIYLNSRDTTMRQRVKFLTLGTVLGTLPFLVFNIALGKLLGRDDFALLGTVPMVLVPVSFGYSIARYRLMDVEVIIRRSLIYAALTGAVVGAYLVLVVVVGNVVLNLSGQNSQLVAIVATLIIAAAFAPARERIQGFLERRFFREKHDLQRALHDLSRAMQTTIDKEELEELVFDQVRRLLHPTRIEYLEAREDGMLVLGEGDEALHLPRITLLLNRRGGALNPEIVQGELARLGRGGEDRQSAFRQLRAEARAARDRGFEVLVPAIAGDRLVGGLALGPKRSELAYDGLETETLEILARQMAVQLENTRLYREAVERKRLEEELAVARGIQQRLLPSEVPHLEGFEVAAVNEASSQVSGDYYDFVPMADRWGMVIADVAGKGLPASLLASNLQASIRALASSQSKPGAILQAVNTSLYESTDPEHFATAFLLCLDPTSGRVTYSNAGHNPPYLIRRDGRVETLRTGSTPLGAFPGMDYDEDSVELAPDDLLVLYTDGITEAEAPDGSFFGEEGLEAILTDNFGKCAEDILCALQCAVAEHGRGNVSDDMTLIVIRRTGEFPASSPGADA